MLQYIMEFFAKLVATLLNKPKALCIGPNTLDELLVQFDAPPKHKTPQDIIRDYQVKETMAALEVDMLKMDPALAYRGCQSWFNENNTLSLRQVPCVVRPEVIYCAYGKS
jgi:hypothetical protein